MTDETEPATLEPDEPQFNPLRTWGQLVDELGDPTASGRDSTIPEEDLDR